ncbi:hypothetical protein FQ707_13835 [Bacteroidaceae bacterium HV4-6-C5C]|nr:hypothetical protein FQ707_13835 [Bacteroidaceae bacterium HV4-6-C5C]
MKIEDLLERYFEGTTSCEEEKELRRFFSGKNVPEHLEIYSSFFVSLDMESKEFHRKQPRTKSNFKQRVMYSMVGIAAGLLLIIGVSQIFQNNQSVQQDYVIINGKKYTDAKIVREQALDAFNDMKMSKEDMRELMFE